MSLKAIKILSEDNEEVLFSDFLNLPKVIIVFVRHFGCIACRAKIEQISKLTEDIGKNQRIIFIGNGGPHLIKTFKDELNLPNAEIYTDPSLRSFDACGMHRGLRSLLSIKSFISGKNLYKEGYRQGAFDTSSGAHTQMGGVVIFVRPGKVLYHFTSEYLGHFDSIDEWSLQEGN